MWGRHTISALEHMTILADVHAAHAVAIREADARFSEERDRRYAEVAVERQRAVTAKEEAATAALDLARAAQVYKDEKANELREQISSERGNYATQSDLAAAMEKIEAMVRPLSDWVATQQGRSSGISDGGKLTIAVITVALTVVTVVVGVYAATR